MITHETNLENFTCGEILLFRTIWHHSSDNMFIVRYDEKDGFINEACNLAQEKTFGLSPNEANNAKLKDLLDKTNYELIEKRYKDCIFLNKAVTYDEKVNIDDSGLRYFNTTILPVKDDKTTKIFGISREVTELIKKE